MQSLAHKISRVDEGLWMSSPPEPTRDILPARGPQRTLSGSWTERYGERHRFRRVTDFPAGIQPPRRVRIYRRADGLLLQWWDPAAKTNLSDRVDGDLVEAISKARQIEERLLHFKTSGGSGKRRFGFAQLVDSFLADLRQRANAGDIASGTVDRYRAALQHFLAFCEQPAIVKCFPYAANINREFRLQLSVFLTNRKVSPNGRAEASHRPMTAQSFVLDTVRALFEWASDPERGNLLPEGFRNPFRRLGETRTVLRGDPLADPDITLPMAVDLVHACDRFQLRLFVPLLLFGLRAAEPCLLFVEYLDTEWLRVPCSPDLDYRTKGRRDKRFPLLDEIQDFWRDLHGDRGHGLLNVRRCVADGQEQARMCGASMIDVVAEYRQRCARIPGLNAAQRQKLRDAVIHDAGGLTYDHIQDEFASLAKRLKWPRQATLKDLRHLFATTLNNASMPEAYRRYLMGQSPGKAAIVAYTHLNELRRHYTEAVRREWQPLIAAIQTRVQEIRSSTPS
jgi:hypothetical protein